MTQLTEQDKLNQLISYGIQNGKSQQEILQAALKANLDVATAATALKALKDSGVEFSGPQITADVETTESEKTAGFLATRIAGGIRELERLRATNEKAMSPTLGVETTRKIFGDDAANYITDSDRQQVIATQLDILDSALTLGTGAAYTAEQLEGYRKSYFPQLGDSESTVQSKQARLDQLLESAKVKAGNAAPLIDEALGKVSTSPENATDQSVVTQTNMADAIRFIQENPEDPQAVRMAEELRSGAIDPITGERRTPTVVPNEEGAVEGFLKGLGKSVVSTVQGAANAGNKVFGGAASTILGTENQELPQIPSQFTTADSGAEQAGKITGDIAQFFIPGTGGLKVGALAAKTGMSPGLIAKLAKAIPGMSEDAVKAGALGTAQEGDGDAGDLLRNAILFGTLGKIGTGLGKVGSAITEKLPGKLYDSAVKPPLDEIRKSIMYKGKTLGQELLDRNIKGSDKKILNTAIERLNKNEDVLAEILKKSSSVLQKSELAPYFEKLVKRIDKTPGMKQEIEIVNKVIQDIPQTLSLAEANAIKRNLYTALSDKAFKLDASMTTKRDAMKTLASGIKDQIEKKTAAEFGDGTVKKLNQELSVFGRARDSITDKIARAEKNNILGLGNITTGVGGAVAGGPLGAAAAVAAKEILSSTPVKTYAAAGLKKAGEVASSVPANLAKKVAKNSIFKGLQGFFGGN